MNRLEQLRNEKGFTKREMAKTLGIPYTTYVGYETGERGLNSEKIKKLSDKLGVSADYLIGRSEVRTPIITIDNEPDDKYEDIIRICHSLTDENLASLKDYALYLLKRQEGDR